MQLFDTNYVVAAEPIDPAFVGTLQEYFDHCVTRLSIKSPTAPYNVIVSDSKPPSNQGLLLLGGTKIYVWDEDQATYVPANISDSLFAPGTGKAVFTVDEGNFIWKNPTDFATWLGMGIGSLTPGAAGTIAYSNGTVNAWGIPETALTAKSVSVSKLKCEAADAGKFPQAQGDGSVVWAATGTARGQIASVESSVLPSSGDDVSIPRPAGAVLLQAKLVAVASPLFTGYANGNAAGDYGWLVGDEVDLGSVDLESGSGSRLAAFNVITSAAGDAWIVFRKFSLNGEASQNHLEVVNRSNPTGAPVYVNTASGKWKIVLRYL